MRLLEVSLMGVDLDELRRFYCAILGLREIEPLWTGRLAVQCGATRLYFRATEPGWHGRYHFALDIPAGRFEAALGWLAERRAPLTSLDGRTRFHSTSWDADSVYFTDPQGNILELIARNTRPPADPLEPDRPFSQNEILSISELGVCTENVTGSVATLQTRIPGLPIYSGEGDDQFTAIGDHHGLLIVVRLGRIWMPDTGVPASPLPLEVLLEMEEGRRYRLTAPPYPFLIQPEN